MGPDLIRPTIALPKPHQLKITRVVSLVAYQNVKTKHFNLPQNYLRTQREKETVKRKLCSIGFVGVLKPLNFYVLP